MFDNITVDRLLDIAKQIANKPRVVKIKCSYMDLDHVKAELQNCNVIIEPSCSLTSGMVIAMLSDNTIMAVTVYDITHITM